MDSKAQIAATIASERANGLNASEAEILRYAIWAVWTARGEAQGLDDADMPSTMSSTEWADACEALGIKRGTAMNRHSEARRNWEAMQA